MLLQSPRVQPKSIIAPQVDLHSEIRVNEFYNASNLGAGTLGLYMPVKTVGAQNTDDLDNFDFDRSANEMRS